MEVDVKKWMLEYHTIVSCLTKEFLLNPIYTKY